MSDDITAGGPILIRNCIIKGRPDQEQPIFVIDRVAGRQVMTAVHLDGYAIIPIEEYDQQAKLLASLNRRLIVWMIADYFIAAAVLSAGLWLWLGV